MKRQVLWGISLFLPLAALSPAASAQTTAVIERGPHHQIVQTVSPDGSTNTFVELRTGWTGGEFVVRQLTPETASFEHVSFAPMDIPPLPP